MDFYPSAAAAVGAGYRACRRCRPDATPGSPEWDVRSDVVARAMRLVRDGEVDRAGVRGLSARLGYSVRQLERLMLAELGAGPAALARSQRAHTARQLIEATALPLTDVAFAAGFGSIRSFNEAVLEVYACTPTELRARAGRPGPDQDSGTPQPATLGAVQVRLPFRVPFTPDNLFGHLAATAVPGVEEWRDGAYRLTLRLPHGPGIGAVRPGAAYLSATLWLSAPRDLAPAIARCRALLDLDADPVAVGEMLGADPALGSLWAAAPGRRVPRSVDAAQFALRAVLGQQISVARAAHLAGGLVARLGEPVTDPGGRLTHLFPTPAQVAELDPETLPMPRARGRTLIQLAEALAVGTVDLSPGADRTEARTRLGDLPGIRPWTVETVALRGLGDPDAFPAGDLGVRKGLQRLGLPPAAAERWRPWRAYATQYLWAASTRGVSAGGDLADCSRGSDAINRMPKEAS